jgi:hypothetical protein
VSRTIEITPAGIALIRIDRTLTAAGFSGSVVDLDGIARRVDELVKDRDTWKRRAIGQPEVWCSAVGHDSFGHVYTCGRRAGHDGDHYDPEVPAHFTSASSR